MTNSTTAKRKSLPPASASKFPAGNAHTSGTMAAVVVPAAPTLEQAEAELAAAMATLAAAKRRAEVAAVAKQKEEAEAARFAEIAKRQEEAEAMATLAAAKRRAEVAAEAKRQEEVEAARVTALIKQRMEDAAAKRQEDAALATTAPANEIDAAELARFAKMARLVGFGPVQRKVRAAPEGARRLQRSEETVTTVAERDYEDTGRVQQDLLALVDLMGGVLRVKDVVEHVSSKHGGVMAPSNIRYHLQKLEAEQILFKGSEATKEVPGKGVREFWVKDPAKAVDVWKKAASAHRGYVRPAKA